VPGWSSNYLQTLVDRFTRLTDGLHDRVDDIAEGRVAPALDDIVIGSGRRVRAAALFFDIEGFSSRTQSSKTDPLKETLYMLDCVIPMLMHVVFDAGGYIEKNTGDGAMAIIGVGDDDDGAANDALDIATTGLYVLKNVVNPHLIGEGIAPVRVRVTMDLGTLLLARVGTPKGAAKHDRSFLSAIGPSANLASKLQDKAAGDEIWVGDLVKTHAAEYRRGWFIDETPANWTWTWVGGSREGQTYRIWRYTGRKTDPT
jgi:class 3 adenylate cyclase